MGINSSEWWKPKPMSQQDMEIEISQSRIKDAKPSSELPPEAVHETLKALNLTDRYVSNQSASRTGS